MVKMTNKKKEGSGENPEEKDKGDLLKKTKGKRKWYFITLKDGSSGHYPAHSKAGVKKELLNFEIKRIVPLDPSKDEGA